MDACATKLALEAVPTIAPQTNTDADVVVVAPPPERVPYTISRGGGKIRACHGCRQAKAKCDGDGVASCRRCSRLSFTCRYPDGCAIIQSAQATRGAKRTARELVTQPGSITQSLPVSQLPYYPPRHKADNIFDRPSALKVPQGNLLAALEPRNHNQTSWTDILHRPELTSSIQSEGWTDHLRTLLMFALQNDDSLQLGYVLVMARSSGLTLRDLIRSPAEQAHAAQLMFGGTTTTPQLQDIGAQYASIIQELNKTSLEDFCGPIPPCLEWIWGARDCALLLFFTNGDGNTNFFMNTLFSNTVQTKENFMSALASNRALISCLAPSEREAMMSIRVRSYAEIAAQSPIYGENGSSHKALRVELKEENINSLGSSFIEFAAASTNNVELRYVCLCIRPKQAAIEDDATILGDFSPRRGAEERRSDDEFIASIFGDGEMTLDGDSCASEALEI